MPKVEITNNMTKLDESQRDWTQTDYDCYALSVPDWLKEIEEDDLDDSVKTTLRGIAAYVLMCDYVDHAEVKGVMIPARGLGRYLSIQGSGSTYGRLVDLMRLGYLTRDGYRELKSGSFDTYALTSPKDK